MAAKRSRIEDESFDNEICFEKLHLNAKWSDVNFIFKSGERTVEHVPAHKMLLANGSDVFAAKFYGEWKEDGDITVTDISISALKEFLQFFYLKRVPLTVENVAEVLSLGHKYNVENCIDACVQFMKDVFTVENVCICLNHAIFYQHEKMQKYCEEYIAHHSVAVFKSKSFIECDRKVLAVILKLDSISCSDTVVFAACMSWIKAKSKQTEVTEPLIQEYLGELFYEIRFISLTAKEFDALSTEYQYAFSLAEYKDIVRTLTLPEVMPKLFNRKPRQRLWNADAVIVCDRKRADLEMGNWSMVHDKSTILETNQPILLGQLIFAPIAVWRNGQYEDLKSDFPIDVTIIESSNLNNADDASSQTLSKFKINLGSREETMISLPVPVNVRPKFYYEIRLNPLESVSNHGYQNQGVKAEVQMEDGPVITFRGDRYSGSSTGLVNILTGLGLNKI